MGSEARPAYACGARVLLLNENGCGRRGQLQKQSLPGPFKTMFEHRLAAAVGWSYVELQMRFKS
jgi:hypothetical protein